MTCFEFQGHGGGALELSLSPGERLEDLFRGGPGAVLWDPKIPPATCAGALNPTV